MSNIRRTLPVKGVVVVYVLGFLVVIFLAAGTYATQWRREVDSARMRYLEVYVQALRQYSVDHGKVPTVPTEPHIISNQAACSYPCSALGRVLPCFDAQPVLVPGYLNELYRDSWGTKGESDSAFYLQRTSTSTILVGACNAFYCGPFERVATGLRGE